LTPFPVLQQTGYPELVLRKLDILPRYTSSWILLWYTVCPDIQQTWCSKLNILQEYYKNIKLSCPCIQQGTKANFLSDQGKRQPGYSAWVYNILKLDILPWINQGMLYMMIQEMVSKE
jgi:hypothetical protein